MKFSFIVNPVSRSGLKVYSRYINLVREYGYKYEVFFTEGRGHATNITRNVGGDVILVAGGDGTLNEVINGVLLNNLDIPVAPVFGGTGCDVARSLGAKKNPEKRFEEILSMGIKFVHPVMLKTGEGLRYFVGVSDIGFGAVVAYRFDGLRRFGRMGYAIGVMQTLYELKPLSIDMSIGNRKYNGSVIMVVYANSPFFGGGMKISPNSNITGGNPRVIVIKYIHTLKFLYYFPRVYKGEHLKIKYVEEFESPNLDVFTKGLPIECEGEFAGTSPAHYELRRDILLRFV